LLFNFPLEYTFKQAAPSPPQKKIKN